MHLLLRLCAWLIQAHLKYRAQHWWFLVTHCLWMWLHAVLTKDNRWYCWPTLVDYSYIPFNVLTATISVSAVLCHFKWALNTKPNSPENILNWNHSLALFRWIFPTDLALYYPETWACHLEWSYCLAAYQPSQQTADHLGRLCIYIYIYILSHIQCRVITRKLPNFTCTCMEAQNVEYPPPWSCQISRLWSHLALGAAKYHCLSVFARLTWYSDI